MEQNNLEIFVLLEDKVRREILELNLGLVLYLCYVVEDKIFIEQIEVDMVKQKMLFEVVLEKEVIVLI